MSVSSVGSSNPFAYLQRLLWPDDSDPAAGAAPSEPLQALYQAVTGGQSGDPLVSAAISSSDGLAASSGAPQFSPDVMKALLSVQGNQGKSPGKLESLLGKFDTDGDGQISQSEFETAIGPAADKTKVDELFQKLDTNGDGAISLDELKAALQRAHGGHHHHHSAEGAGDQGGAGGANGSDPLQALLSGAAADGTTSQSTTNADGSSTTTITYADGTKVEMTTPAAASNAGAASSDPEAPNFANLLKQLISLQAQLAAPTTSLSI
jgi:Ca2+-binding EF-hand superfamily protein